MRRMLNGVILNSQFCSPPLTLTERGNHTGTTGCCLGCATPHQTCSPPRADCLTIRFEQALVGFMASLVPWLGPDAHVHRLGMTVCLLVASAALWVGMPEAPLKPLSIMNVADGSALLATAICFVVAAESCFVHSLFREAWPEVTSAPPPGDSGLVIESLLGLGDM